MQPPCGNVRGKQEDVALSLMIPLSMKMIDEFAEGTSLRTFAQKDQFDRHYCFADSTQRSAYAFKLGLRAGRTIALIPPAARIVRNDAQNFVSRSWNTERR